MSNLESHPTTLKHALPDIMDTFQQRIEADGEFLHTTTLVTTPLGAVERTVPSVRFGTFGVLCNNVNVHFVQSAKEVLGGDEPGPLNNKASALMDKVEVAERGIYVAGMYAEVAALHLLLENPELVDDGKEVAAGVARGYDFIEKSIVDKGRMIGSAVATNYVEGDLLFGASDDHFRGSVARRQLTDIGTYRLARFETEQAEGGAKVVPVGLDVFMPRLRQQYTSPQDRLVNCPGHIYRRPGAERNYNREIFDIMLNNMKAHVFPDYLPEAMEVLNREWLELPTSESARS